MTTSPAPRILVLSASVGAGHMSAAAAVAEALRLTRPDAVVTSLDVLEFSTRSFRRVYGKLYLDLINKAPQMLGYFYDLLDRPATRGSQMADRVRLALELKNLQKFLAVLTGERWDVIVNTHFLPAEIIAHLRIKKGFATPQITVTTDFCTHRMWLNQPCDHYFTATPDGAHYLTTLGVPATDVTVSGIPIHPKFRAVKERAACRAKHGLSADRPVLLQLAGGFGVGPIEQITLALTEIETPCDIAVVTGKNEAIRASLAKLKTPARHRVIPIGFTTEIDDYMRAADLLISKPGGLTTSETLACGTPMVIVNPVPGQESQNSDVLLENGAAVKVQRVSEIPGKVNALLADRERLAALQKNCRRLGRPDAAFVVAQKALSFLR